MRSVFECITCVENAIEKANLHTTTLTKKQLNVKGCSTENIRIFLNEIIANDTNYLEIGIRFGSTFIPAISNRDPKNKIAMDSFQHGGETDFHLNCASNNIKDFRLIKSDCFNLDADVKSSIQNIDVYFYDAEHTFEDQKKAFTYYYNNLANVFIVAIDDYIYGEIVDGTQAGIKETNLKIHKDWVLPAPTWWNGFYIAVCEKNPLLSNSD